MSWQATSRAARQAAGNTIRKCLLLLIANDSNRAEVCWSGQKRPAQTQDRRLRTVVCAAEGAV